jgi:hypothetical protein
VDHRDFRTLTVVRTALGPAPFAALFPAAPVKLFVHQLVFLK